MNYVFFGTDEFAVKVLEELAKNNLAPNLIVTTPDKVAGKRNELTPPPVKMWAQEHGIDFIQPEKLADLELDQNLFVIASYGKILPRTLLDRPKHGVLNIHPSLLPKYRGSSPLQSAILNGDTETGVSIMLLDERMDHGPILAATSLELKAISFLELRDKLAQMGAELLANILPDYLAGKITPTEQDHGQATYTKKIEKKDGEIKLTDDPILNERKIRALNPNPGTYFIDDNGKRIKIITAHLEKTGGQTSCQLILDRVIPEGKKEMDWESYLRGKK